MKFMLRVHKLRSSRKSSRATLDASSSHISEREEQCRKRCTGNQRRSLLNETMIDLQRHQRHSQEHLQEYQHGVRCHLSEVHHEIQVQQVASREELEMLRRELSQSFAQGSHYQNLFRTSRSSASERLSGIQHDVNRKHVKARFVLSKRGLRKFLSCEECWASKDKFDYWQAEVCRFGSERLQLS